MKSRLHKLTIGCYIILFLLVVTTHSSHAQSSFVKFPTMRGFQVSNTLSLEDIAVLQSWKTNVVRYPLIWADPVGLDSSNQASWNSWFQNSLSLLDQQLALYENAEIKVILNLYSPPGGFVRRDSKSTHRLFTDTWAQQTFLDAWTTLADKYGNDTRIVAFDLLNEPAEAERPKSPLKDWNNLAQAATQIVRARSEKPIIMTPVYGKTSRISKMRKLKFKNIIYTIHFYEPFRFIHQGIEKYPLRVQYPDKRWNSKALEKQLKPIISFQRRNKIRVYIGEFSVARWAPNGSGARYLKDVLRIFEKYKWDWTYHAFREANVWSLEHSDKFADQQPATKPTARLKTIQSFLKRNKRI